MASIDTVLQKGTPLIKNTTSQKCNLTQMASHNYIIGFLKYYLDPANNITYPCSSLYPYRGEYQKHNSEAEKSGFWNPMTISLKHATNLRISFKKSAQSMENIKFGHSDKVCHFLRHHVLWVTYLSVTGKVFVMYHFCKGPFFSNGIEGCHFWWVFLMVEL